MKNEIILYPASKESVGVKVAAKGGKMTVKRAEMWEMGPRSSWTTEKKVNQFRNTGCLECASLLALSWRRC